MDRIFNFSEMFVFCTIALYPAKKLLPNGENAHITLKSVGWWVDLFEQVAKNFGGRKFFLVGMRSTDNMIFLEG